MGESPLEEDLSSVDEGHIVGAETQQCYWSLWNSCPHAAMCSEGYQRSRDRSSSQRGFLWSTAAHGSDAPSLREHVQAACERVCGCLPAGVLWQLGPSPPLIDGEVRRLGNPTT